jgi:hypothetical protein
MENNCDHPELTPLGELADKQCLQFPEEEVFNGVYQKIRLGRYGNIVLRAPSGEIYECVSWALVIPVAYELFEAEKVLQVLAKCYYEREDSGYG